ncbi:hypothetical protein Vretimale_326 [Volvox reticuliferus]|uniref:Uncharacterized protein n=1 Tax=Volvox reticuliferus TaxID=1737510 RepID=A0A8J4C5Q2_9CHLO|nr:hypothetical protein Vretifemale_2553 [Volvox reticuliferus]GIL94182.1 hypothetical protein Vretimale_326 [Volvox reticuliferus]
MAAPGGIQKLEMNIDGLGERIRWLPAISPGPADLDGRVTHHAMMAWGGQNSKEDKFLVITDLEVVSRGHSVLRVDEEMVKAFPHEGKMTDLHVCEQGGGLVNVLFGTTEGTLHLLRLLLPRTPGALPKDVRVLKPPGLGQLPELDADASEDLAVWLRPHRGAVAAVDMQQETKKILTAGADGSLFVLEMEKVAAVVSSVVDTANSMDADGDEDGSAMDTMDTGEQRRGRPCTASGSGAVPPELLPYKAGTGCIGYTCARWADRNRFVTSQSLGGLEMWDVRCPPEPVMRSKEWGAVGLGPAERGSHGAICSLQVHPARPDVCASGGLAGSVALWDLRASSKPMSLTRPDIAAGPVWEVHFDTRESTQSSTGQQAPLPSVLYCTEDGGLFHVSATEGPAARGPQVLTQLPVAINSFDVGGPFGTDVAAVTDRQTLMFMQTA